MAAPMLCLSLSMDGGNYKPQVRRKEGEKMTKSSKDLWIEKQTAEIARLKERVAELEAANRRDSLLGHAEMEENNNLIVDLRKKVESLEARAVRWEGKGVAPNDGETIVALCDVGGRRVFRPIIYVAGYG